FTIGVALKDFFRYVLLFYALYKLESTRKRIEIINNTVYYAYISSDSHNYFSIPTVWTA
ncbi:unnamed protein product, partial [marine sediment metagenome]